MAIVGKSLAKGAFDSVGASWGEIYQVPINKKALIKHFHFYNTILTGVSNGYISITDSSDVELVRLWWTADLSAETVAVDSDDFIFLTDPANGMQNIILEDQQKIRMLAVVGSADWHIEADISGAEEDV